MFRAHHASAAALVLFAAALSVPDARAALITVNAGASLAANTAALNAFNRAATRLGAYFADPVTIHVDADFGGVGSPDLAAVTSPTLLQGSYNTVRGLLVADAADEADDAIVAALPTAGQFVAYVPQGISLENALIVSQATAKALGVPGVVTSDATITFNASYGFDFDNSDGVAADLVDFESVVLRELVRTLGFSSAIEGVDALVNSGASDALVLHALDLFRFRDGELPASAAAFTTRPRLLVPGQSASFSDAQNVYAFAPSSGYWLDDAITGVRVGIMDPTLPKGVALGLSAADLRALDVIGWDLAEPESEPVPEPLSVLLLGAGVVAVLRRRT